MKGCTHILNAVYFAPNQIRTCCQRFFRGSELCGDVVLFSTEGLSEEQIAIKIVSSKYELLSLINSEKSDPCNGCHSLVEISGDISISHVSIEDSSVCNMRCSYCSPTYYGGFSSDYNVSKVLRILSNSGALADSVSFFWGGGEPVISKDFEYKLSEVISLPCVNSLRFFSNSLVYSNALASTLSSGKAQLTTSVDAGSENSFASVRGARSLSRVLSNLQKYIRDAKDPLQVTIKYILVHENSSYSELINFIGIYAKYPEFFSTHLQISMDFKASENTIPLLTAALDLYSLYLSAGGRNAYLDDHILHAISRLMVTNNFTSYLKNRPEVLRLEKIASESEWVIVGDGSFANYLASKTYLSSLKPPRACLVFSNDAMGIPNIPSIDIDGILPSDLLVIGSVSYRNKIISRLSNILSRTPNVVYFPVF